MYAQEETGMMTRSSRMRKAKDGADANASVLEGCYRIHGMTRPFFLQQIYHHFLQLLQYKLDAPAARICTCFLETRNCDLYRMRSKSHELRSICRKQTQTQLTQQYLFACYYIGSWLQMLCHTIESPPYKACIALPPRRSACIYIVTVTLTFYRQRLQPHISLGSNTSSTDQNLLQNRLSVACGIAVPLISS
jgi:hypothetical protein